MLYAAYLWVLAYHDACQAIVTSIQKGHMKRERKEKQIGERRQSDFPHETNAIHLLSSWYWCITNYILNLFLKKTLFQ